MPIPTISESKIWSIMLLKTKCFTPKAMRYWRFIEINPERWVGVDNNGSVREFWVVAIFGRKIIWYNDIEEGFGICDYSEYKKIDKYYADENDLGMLIEQIRRELVGEMEYGQRT